LRGGDGVATRDLPVPPVPVQARLLRRRDRGLSGVRFFNTSFGHHRPQGMATGPLPREPVRDEPVLGNQVAYEYWLAEDAYCVDWKSQRRRRRRRRLRSLLLAILAAALLLALAAGAWIATRGTGSETTVTTSAPQVTQPTLLPPAPARVTMPYLLGIQLREARTVLADQSADLRVRIRRIASRQLVGEVVSQSPPSSSKIAPNAFVALSPPGPGRCSSRRRRPVCVSSREASSFSTSPSDPLPDPEPTRRR